MTDATELDGNRWIQETEAGRSRLKGLNLHESRELEEAVLHNSVHYYVSNSVELCKTHKQ